MTNAYCGEPVAPKHALSRANRPSEWCGGLRFAVCLRGEAQGARAPRQRQTRREVGERKATGLPYEGGSRAAEREICERSGSLLRWVRSQRSS